jgi:branched-chain amino acid transport system substrate-binding protein
LRHLIALLFCVTLSTTAYAEILVGIAGPFTGQNAVYGSELRVGVTAAIASINASGGINGETLTLVEGDDGCDAKRAIETANMFVGKDVRLVVGHFCASASLAAAPIYVNAGILMLNPSVTSPDLTSKNLWNVFRLTGRDDTQADIAAMRIKTEGQGSDVFVITDDQTETAAFAKRFVGSLPNAKVVKVKAGSPKLPDEAGLIVATSVYLALQPGDAAVVAKDLRKLNSTAAFYSSDLLQSESYGSKAGDGANATHVTFLQDSMRTALPNQAAKLPSTQGATLAAYAAVETFAAAAKARNVNDSRAMAAWLSAGNEVATIIGTLRFNTSGDLQQQPYEWYTWQNGNLQRDLP